MARFANFTKEKAESVVALARDLIIRHTAQAPSRFRLQAAIFEADAVHLLDWGRPVLGDSWSMTETGPHAPAVATFECAVEIDHDVLSETDRETLEQAVKDQSSLDNEALRQRLLALVTPQPTGVLPVDVPWGAFIPDNYANAEEVRADLLWWSSPFQLANQRDA